MDTLNRTHSGRLITLGSDPRKTTVQADNCSEALTVFVDDLIRSAATSAVTYSRKKSFNAYDQRGVPMKKPWQKRRKPEHPKDRIFLDVGFEDGEKVKALGAKWDSGWKMWYITSDQNELPFKQWRFNYSQTKKT